MKEVGILDREIYRYDTILFVIMDTVAEFDHDQAMLELVAKPRQSEWEAYVAKFQEADAEATPTCVRTHYRLTSIYFFYQRFCLPNKYSKLWD